MTANNAVLREWGITKRAQALVAPLTPSRPTRACRVGIRAEAGCLEGRAPVGPAEGGSGAVRRGGGDHRRAGGGEPHERDPEGIGRGGAAAGRFVADGDHGLRRDRGGHVPAAGAAEGSKLEVR
jgi:hypothetical protein